MQIRTCATAADAGVDAGSRQARKQLHGFRHKLGLDAAACFSRCCSGYRLRQRPIEQRQNLGSCSLCSSKLLLKPSLLNEQLSVFAAQLPQLGLCSRCPSACGKESARPACYCTSGAHVGETFPYSIAATHGYWQRGMCYCTLTRLALHLPGSAPPQRQRRGIASRFLSNPCCRHHPCPLLAHRDICAAS